MQSRKRLEASWNDIYTRYGHDSLPPPTLQHQEQDNEVLSLPPYVFLNNRGNIENRMKEIISFLKGI